MFFVNENNTDPSPISIFHLIKKQKTPSFLFYNPPHVLQWKIPRSCRPFSCEKPIKQNSKTFKIPRPRRQKLRVRGAETNPPLLELHLSQLCRFRASSTSFFLPKLQGVVNSVLSLEKFRVSD
ncbi:unnamed protein product [Citrullus colocynthis]|uniref:Uncharacterized protein n=1 Tax=Citrullus colocynthis TaxID=252529 RepID=A0ABP0YX85_9ROSI